jgi:tetratricopeptide (TPR) repeat protein
MALASSNVEVLESLAFDELSLGRWDAAREHLEQAVRRDPRSIAAFRRLGELLLSMRQYPEATRVLDRALQFAPANLDVIELRALVALAQGQLSAARAVIRKAADTVDPTALVAHVAVWYDTFWALDEAQQQLLVRLSPSAFDDNRGLWGLVLTQTYAAQGDSTKARVYGDSARQAFRQHLLASPQDAQLRALYGLTLAYLGEKAAAVKEGERGVALLPITKDAYLGPYIQHQLARIYLLVGKPEKSLDLLEPLLKVPYHLSPGWLRIDPTLAALHGNTRFERLAKAR